MPEEMETVQETVEETVNESAEETTEEIKNEEVNPVETIRSKIKNFFNKQEAEPETVVPDDFTQTALNAGWSSEDIQDFAKDYTEDELKEMIPTLLDEEPEASEPTSDTPKEEEVEESKDEDSQEDEQVKKLNERIEALEKALGKSQEKEEREELIGLVHKASQAFDEVSKEFEVFGKTDELPRFPDGRLIPTSPAVKARNEVFGLARQLTGTGMDFDDALSVSLNAYKGRNLTKDVERKYIKSLKDKEKRLSGKRTSHESGTKDLSGPEVIKAILAKNNR